jgi:hypothetical protein
MAKPGTVPAFPFDPGGRRFAALPLALAVLLFLAGCAGYRAGGLPETGISRLYLEPVQNEAYLSGITPLFQDQLRRAVLQSRSLEPVDSREAADLVAYVRLTDFRERPVAFLGEDTGQAISSRLSLAARMTLSDAGSGKEILADESYGTEAPVYSDPDTAFPNAVDQTKPVVARNLAATVTLAIELAAAARR